MSVMLFITGKHSTVGRCIIKMERDVTNFKAVLGLSPHDDIHPVRVSPTVQLGKFKSLLLQINLPQVPERTSLHVTYVRKCYTSSQSYALTSLPIK